MLNSCVLVRKVKCARCINCSYNKMAKVIRLLDKNATFVYSGFFFIRVRAFESNIPYQAGRSPCNDVDSHS